LEDFPVNAAVLAHQIAKQLEPSPAVAGFLRRGPRLLIAGEWVE
jgi:hypothetical protein